MKTPGEKHEGFAIDRRTALAVGGGAVGLGALAATCGSTKRTPVFTARSQNYSGDLAATIRDGLLACGLQGEHFRGKRVLLKPNLVEPSRDIPHMTTHPAVVVAAAEAFRRFGAQVAVGEAPGHIRDTQMALDESGMGEAIDDAEVSFADLNYEQVSWRANAGRFSKLKDLYFPRSVVEADFVVSMPKMKTHHWVGMTCSMKNLYGVLPGIKYGWPKNVLHHNGIPETVADIAATLPRSLAIVDGIDCMEGDGPILGSMKRMGLLVVGANLAAVDATVARIMGLEPQRISYLALVADKLGPLSDRRIEQRGERWQDVASPFQMLELEHLQRLRSATGALVS